MTKKYLYSPGLGRMMEVDSLPEAGRPTARSKRLQMAFVQKVPLKEAAAAFKAVRAQKAFVWLWLLYRAWDTKSPTFPVPNGELKQYGIRRETKLHALRSYEEVGLIKLERKGRRNSPIVTLLVALPVRERQQ